MDAEDDVHKIPLDSVSHPGMRAAMRQRPVSKPRENAAGSLGRRLKEASFACCFLEGYGVRKADSLFPAVQFTLGAPVLSP